MLYRKIDENGLFIEDVIFSEAPVLTEIITEDVEHVSYSEDGEELITVESVERTVAITDDNGNTIADPQYIVEPVPQGFYHPKWNDSEWVEGLSGEEIEELTKPQTHEPTELDQLKIELEQANEISKSTSLALTELIFMIMSGGL